MTRDDVVSLRDKLQKVLDSVGPALRHKLSLGSCRYGDTANFKLECSPMDVVTGEPQTKSAADFKRFAIEKGYPSDGIGRVVVSGNGTRYIVNGFLRRCKKYQLDVKRESDGKLFRIPDNVTWLERYPEIDTFQDQLDQNPHNHTLRLVMADWMQDHNDDRCEGYRALVRLNIPLFKDERDGKMVWFRESSAPKENDTRRTYRFSSNWFDVIEDQMFGNKFHHWINFNTRREAEDRAALAFRRLPLSDRTRLLKGSV